MLIAVAALSLMFLVTEVQKLRSPVQRDYGEGHVLWMSQQITNHEKAYKSLDSLPYVVFPYTPIYLLTSRAAGELVGDSLVAGRGLSLLCTIGIALVIALTIFSCTPASFPRILRLTSAAFGAGLTFGMESVIGWGGLMRVDMLAFFLMFAGLGVYVVLGRRERWQYLAATLFVLAAFTKQTAISAPLACAAFGLATRPAATIRVFGFATILGLTALFFCNRVTDGGFWKNIVEYNLNPFSWKVALVEVYGHLLKNIPTTAMAAAAFLAVWNGSLVRHLGWRRFLRKRGVRLRDRAVLIGTLNCLLAGVGTVTIGKDGSSYNFFLAWDISLCYLGGFFLFGLLAAWSRVTRNTHAGFLGMGLMCLLSLLPGSTTLDLLAANSTTKLDSQRQEESGLIQLIRATPGPVLSENLLVLDKADREVLIEPATISFLTRAGGWDERPFLRLVNEQYFTLIIVTKLRPNDRYSPAIASAIEQAYLLVDTIGQYSIYRPRLAR